MDRWVETGERALLLPSVDLPAMPDKVNYNHLLGVKNFVHNPIVANSQLVKPRQIAAEGIWFTFLHICCQPPNSLHDATRDLPVKLCEFACSRVLDADLVHG